MGIYGRKAYQRGYERGLAKGGILLDLELKRPLIVRFIKLTQWENSQIADIMDAPNDFVEAIRVELETNKGQ